MMKKIISMLLVIVMAVCLSSCAKDKEGQPEGKEIDIISLYTEVLEELVVEYGMPMVKETSYTGIQDFQIVDLNDDGKEELFVMCSRSADDFFSAIYTTEGEKVVKAWEETAPAIFDNAYIKKQNGKTCVFLTSTYRGWSSGIIVYTEGKFVNLYDNSQYSDKEQKIYDEAVTKGIGTENNAIIEIHINRIGLSLENKWEEVAVVSNGADAMGLLSDIKLVLREKAAGCREKLETYGVMNNESAEEILAKIPYYGDRNKCGMNADMANAYAEAIAGMKPFYISDPGESWSKEYELCALLADPAGDGMPILITAYLNKYDDSFVADDCDENYGGFYSIQMWGYEDGKAVDAKVQKPDYTNGFGEIDAKTYYRSIEFFHDVGHKRVANYYLIEKGTIRLEHSVELYDAFDSGEGTAYFYGDLPGGKSYPLTAENLSANGWAEIKNNGFSSWYCTIVDGENHTKEYMQVDHDEIIGFSQSDEVAHVNDLEYHIALPNDDAWYVGELLKDYSKK